MVDAQAGAIQQAIANRHAYLGTPEKVRSTAAQLVSVIESR
jgi:hypothetical protein